MQMPQRSWVQMAYAERKTTRTHKTHVNISLKKSATIHAEANKHETHMRQCERNAEKLGQKVEEDAKMDLERMRELQIQKEMKIQKYCKIQRKYRGHPGDDAIPENARDLAYEAAEAMRGVIEDGSETNCGGGAHGTTEQEERRKTIKYGRIRTPAR